MTNTPHAYTGGCHCAAVRFQVTVTDDRPGYDCNGSICRKKGFLHLIVPPEQFTLLQGADNLTTYTFNIIPGLPSTCFAAPVGFMLSIVRDRILIILMLMSITWMERS